MVDELVQPGWRQEHERQQDGDFAALFAQLDCHEAVAPIAGGLHQLVNAIEGLKRERSRFD